eukprot:6491812-Amphidinium_carterae.2
MAGRGTGRASSRAQAASGTGAETRESEGPKGPAPPSWDGTPHLWRKFRLELKLWRLAIPLPTTYSAGARVAFGLSGAARRIALNIPEYELRPDPTNPWRSLEVLEQSLSVLVPDQDLRTTSLLDKFFSSGFGERRIGESIQAYNAGFHQLLSNLADEGVDVNKLYAGFWYLKKARIGREQRERVLQYAYSQRDLHHTRELLSRARREGRTGVRERGRVAMGALLREPASRGILEEGDETEVGFMDGDQDSVGDFDPSVADLYNDLQLLMSVCTRLLPDLHLHDHRAQGQFGRGRGDSSRGRGGGRGGGTRGVLLTDAGGAYDEDDSSWVDVPDTSSMAETLEYEDEGVDAADPTDAAEHALQVLLAEEGDAENAASVEHALEVLATVREARAKRKGKGKGRGSLPGSAPAQGRGSSSKPAASASGSAGSASATKQSIEQRKQRSVCRVCGQRGHWSGDSECPGIQGVAMETDTL